MNTQDVWQRRIPSPSRPTPKHFLVFFLLIAIGAVTGTFGSIAIPVGHGVTGFWPAIVVQVLGGIWFGMWGVLAGVIFPFISNTLAGAELYVSFWYLPSNFIQGFLPALVFRLLKVDPRLRSPRDWFHYLWSGAVVNNFLGALWAVTALRSLGLITVSNIPLFFSSWIIGNGVPAFILGVIFLKFLSPKIINHPTFCRGWWA